MFNLCKQSLSSTRLGDGSEDRGKGRQEIPDLENSAKNLAKNSFDILVLLKGAGTKNVVINRSISHFILVSLKKSCNVLIIESNRGLWWYEILPFCAFGQPGK